MEILVGFSVAYGLTALSVFLFAPLMRSRGVVSRPREGRLSGRVVPLAGGPSLMLGFSVSAALLGLFGLKETAVILFVSVAMGLVGLLDDVRPLPPLVKLLFQVLAAGVLILSGVFVNIFFPVVGVALSFLWFCGVCNAFNLIDNADGVAAGVGAISALTMGVAAYLDGNTGVALASFAVAGAAFGVVPHNFPPARAYLGDSGSLSLGMALAALSVAATWREAGSLLVILVLPLLFVAVPLFDTMFVTVSRIGRGKSPAEGGVDHTAHRLLSTGMPPAWVVLLFYVTAAGVGASAVLFRRSPILLALAGLLVLLAALVAAVAMPSLKRTRISVMRVIKNYRPVVLLVADILIFTLSFILSYLARFDLEIPEVYIPIVGKTLPVVVVVKSGVFYLGGGYRNDSVKRVVRNGLLGTVFSIAALTVAFRFEDLSRGVFIIDFFITVLLCAAVRTIFRRLVEEK